MRIEKTTSLPRVVTKQRNGWNSGESFLTRRDGESSKGGRHEYSEAHTMTYILQGCIGYTLIRMRIPTWRYRMCVMTCLLV